MIENIEVYKRAVFAEIVIDGHIEGETGCGGAWINRVLGPANEEVRGGNG